MGRIGHHSDGVTPTLGPESKTGWTLITEQALQETSQAHPNNFVKYENGVSHLTTVLLSTEI